MDTGVDQRALTFREQADGRKVARLDTGKVVLVHQSDLAKVRDGETWLVQLDHRDLFAVARPIERVKAAPAAAAPVAVHPGPGPAARNPTTVVLARPVDADPEPRVRLVAAEGAGHIHAAAVPVVPKGAAESTTPSAGDAPKHAKAARAVPDLFLRPLDRVAIFVDGANTDYASREAGYHLDFFKVGAFLKGRATFNAAYYYIADFTSRDPQQMSFLDFLAHSGYIVRKKAVKVLRDKDTGTETYKANVDTEMVLDMVNTADNYDVAFLLSGDSDFERCVDLLRSRGKRVYLMTSDRSLSRELSHVADKPIFFLEDYRDLLEREPRPQ